MAKSVSTVSNLLHNSNRWGLLLAVILMLVTISTGCKFRPNANPGYGYANDENLIILKPLTPRPRPILGVHFNFADPPNELIFSMVQSAKGPVLATALRDVGAEDLRMSFHGYYSHLGTEATAKLKQESKLTNIFPWFPIELYINFIKTNNFTTVLGINIEEGPDVAVDLLQRFEKANALNLITSVELGNEPFLSPRPWTPEEYAEKSAAIITALRRFKVKFAIALIVGKDHNTPTRISGDEYCDRTLATLSRFIDLKTSDDLFGVIHLYSRGVTPEAINQLNAIVRKYSPIMKYQVTEYNIRLSLENNPHLTNAYAMEFARKLNRLIVNPDINGLWIHSFPYHSLNYWTDGRKSTVIGFYDKKLHGEALAPGWHLTPAGRVHKFYETWAWSGEILAFQERDNTQFWATRTKDQRIRIGILNDQNAHLDESISFQGHQFHVRIPPYSIACYDLDTTQELAELSLPY